MNIQTAVVLAGGQGQRLRPMVADRPKPLADIAGRPFLTHLLDFWIEQGIHRFMLAVGYRWEMIAERLGDDYQGARIDYTIESSPLGTGGGLLLALQQLDWDDDRPVFVINGDTLFAVNARAMLTLHRKHQADLTLACRRQPDSARFGVLTLDATDCVIEFSARSAPGERWINGGVYLLERSLATTSPRPVALEQELIPGWLAAGHTVCAFRTDAFFIDIGIPEDYQRARRLLPQRPWASPFDQSSSNPPGRLHNV